MRQIAICNHKSIQNFALLFISLWLGFSHLEAQESFPKHESEISFGFGGVDRNFRADHSIHSGRSGFRFGLKCTMKRYPRDDQSHGYRNRAYPQTFLEFFGIQLGYSYEWLRLPSKASAYSFWDMQCSHPTLLFKGYFQSGATFFDSVSQQNYPIFALYHGYNKPRLLLENNFGVGFKLPITKQLILNQMLGLGILAKQENYRLNGHDRYFVFAPIWPFARVGICWLWNNHAK